MVDGVEVLIVEEFHLVPHLGTKNESIRFCSTSLRDGLNTHYKAFVNKLVSLIISQ